MHQLMPHSRAGRTCAAGNGQNGTRPSTTKRAWRRPVNVDELRHYLLAPAGGGIVLESLDGCPVTVLGPASPLASKLIGQVSGSILHDPEIFILEVF